MKMPKIEEFKRWSAESVRAACIRNDLYTKGDNEDYDHMLNWVRRLYPNTENLYFIAEDIVKHSRMDDSYPEIELIMNVMFILQNEAVTTSYALEGQQ